MVNMWPFAALTLFGLWVCMSAMFFSADNRAQRYRRLWLEERERRISAEK